MNISNDLLLLIFVAAYFGFIGAVFGTAFIDLVVALIRRIFTRKHNPNNHQ